MILTGHQIEQEVHDGHIYIDPFVAKRVNPNSYDFSLGDSIMSYTNDILDPKLPQETITHKIGEEGYLLQPDRIYLGHTYETMGSNFFVPVIKGKSSIARLGLFIHVTADLIDIGSINQWTLQLHAVQPMRIYAGMLIGQVTFWTILGEINLYKGKYQGSKGPVESKIYTDFQ